MTYVEITTPGVKLILRLVKSSLFDRSDAYVIVKEIIIIYGNAGPLAGRTEVQIQKARENNEGNEGIIFKSCAPFSECISRISDAQID